MSKIKVPPLANNPIIAYYNDIVSGKEVVGKKIRRVYKKLVADIYDQDSEYEYSPKRADHAITFMEKYCRQSKGKWGGKCLVLMPYQRAATAAIYGFIHKIEGTRKYNEVFLVVGKKNGKSTWASANGLYLLVADGEPGPEVYAVATKYDQAKIIWGEARKMVRKSPVLLKSRETPGGAIRTLVAEMVCDFNDGVFKALGSDSDTLDGLNIHGALMDEIESWKTMDLYNIIRDGDSARDQPLFIETGTAGRVREAVYDYLYDMAKTTIEGYDDPDGFKNEHFLPLIYELDNKDDWKNPQMWYQANPGLGISKRVKSLAEKVEKAKANPRLLKNLMCKEFNIPETVDEAWLSASDIINPAMFDPRELKPRYGIGGADLSSTTDLTAAKVIFMLPGDPHIYVMSMYWLPEDLLEERAQDDKIPYDLWVEQGYMRTSRGNSIHKDDVTEWFLEIQNEYDIYLPWIGYDDWSAKYWVEDMQGHFGGESMVRVPQIMKHLSAPMKKMEADFKSKLIIYNNNPIDKWCFFNTSYISDKNGNIKPVKTINHRKRIDGLSALLDAYVVLQDKMNNYLSLI